MTVNETLAVIRMRQWSGDKDRTRRGTATMLRASGWTPRDSRQADARIVRMIDFERALAVLPVHQQTPLLLAYRDGLNTAEVSRTLCQSVAAAASTLRAARRALASALDRRCLL